MIFYYNSNTFVLCIVITVGQVVMDLKSRIFFTHTSSTQTDHMNLIYPLEGSITIPFQLFNQMASLYYNRAY